MSTHNLCFEQKYEKISENFHFFFLVVKFSIYLNKRVYVMNPKAPLTSQKSNCQHPFNRRPHVQS